jgi:hypothetical protein
MFNEKLFYEICERYGVEIRDGNSKPIIKYEDGKEREVSKEDIILNKGRSEY